MIDRVAGVGMIAVALVVFVYYTAWVFVTVSLLDLTAMLAKSGSMILTGEFSTALNSLLQPFLSKDHDLLGYFPPRFLASAIPAVTLVVLLTFTIGYYGYVKSQQAAKKREKESKKLK